MKFIFSRPEISQGCSHNKYPKIHWERPILAWLEYNGVWFEPNQYGNTSFALSYNYVYDFFDISVFESPFYPNPKEPIEKLEEFLKNSGLKYDDVGATFTLVGDIRKPGKRFFINAESI